MNLDNFLQLASCSVSWCYSALDAESSVFSSLFYIACPVFDTGDSFWIPASAGMTT